MIFGQNLDFYQIWNYEKKIHLAYTFCFKNNTTAVARWSLTWCLIEELNIGILSTFCTGTFFIKKYFLYLQKMTIRRITRKYSMALSKHNLEFGCTSTLLPSHILTWILLLHFHFSNLYQTVTAIFLLRRQNKKPTPFRSNNNFFTKKVTLQDSPKNMFFFFAKHGVVLYRSTVYMYQKCVTEFTESDFFLNSTIWQKNKRFLFF